MNILAALAGVCNSLVTVWPTPARLTMAHWSLQPIRLADPMCTVDLLAGLAAWYNSGLHLGLGEVLELVVDVKVLDTAMETGTILDLP